MEFSPPVPILRILDEAKAREFYEGFLGFTFDWEHRFEASVMIEKFAIIGGEASSEFLDLNHTSKSMISSVPYDPEVRSGAQPKTPANFGIGTLGTPLCPDLAR